MAMAMAMATAMTMTMTMTTMTTKMTIFINYKQVPSHYSIPIHPIKHCIELNWVESNQIKSNRIASNRSFYYGDLEYLYIPNSVYYHLHHRHCCRRHHHYCDRCQPASTTSTCSLKFQCFFIFYLNLLLTKTKRSINIIQPMENIPHNMIIQNNRSLLAWFKKRKWKWQWEGE